MAKMATVSVRVAPELKQAFLLACQANGCTANQVIRAAMQAIAEGSANPSGLRAEIRADSVNAVPAGRPEYVMQIVRGVAADVLRLSRQVPRAIIQR